MIPSEKTRGLINIVFNTLNPAVGGIIVTGLDGEITFVNPSICRMFEYLPDHLIGQDVATLFAGKKVKNMSDVIDIIDLSESNAEKFIVERSDGQQMIVGVSANYLTSTFELEERRFIQTSG